MRLVAKIGNLIIAAAVIGGAVSEPTDLGATCRASVQCSFGSYSCWCSCPGTGVCDGLATAVVCSCPGGGGTHVWACSTNCKKQD